MTEHVITYRCGHRATLSLLGSAETQHYRAMLASQGLCYQCYKAKREAEREEAFIVAKIVAKHRKLPDLVGLSSQVEWAETLRHSIIINLDRLQNAASLMPLELQSVVENTIARIMAIDRADWWLNQREGALIDQRIALEELIQHLANLSDE